MSKPRRPKNESGPAQSGAFSGLASHADPFAAFTNFGGVAAETSEGLTSDFAQAFKRLTKRDATTKVGACNTLQELISTSDEEDVIQAIPEMVAAIKRRYYSKDKHLRKGLCKCIQALFSRGKAVKKKCVPQLGQLLGPWLCLQYDREPEVRTSASDAWNVTFDSVERTKSAVVLCESKLVTSLQRMLLITVDQLKDEEGLRQEEAMEVLENIQTAVLYVCAHLIELSAGSDNMEKLLALLVTELFEENKLCVLGDSKLAKVRAAVYKVIASCLQNASEHLEPYSHQVATFMQNAFSEKTSEVHADLWPAMLLWMKKMPEGLKSVKNVQVTIFQRLFAMLRKTSGIAGSHVTCRSLLPFLMLVDNNMLAAGDTTGAKFCAFAEDFLISLWNGMQSNSLPVSEVPLLLEAWAECWWYLTSNINNSFVAPYSTQIEQQMITNHLVPVMRQCLLSPFRLGSKYIIEKISPVLTKASTMPSLHQPLLAAWTTILSDFEAGAVFCAEYEPKKGKKLLYDSLQESDVDQKMGIKRLAHLLSDMRKAVAPAGVQDYFTEVTLLVGTFLINTLAAPGDAHLPIVSCWKECKWDLVPKLLLQAYTNIIKPCLVKSLRGDPKGTTCVASMSFSHLLSLANVFLCGNDSSTVELLQAAGDCKNPGILATLFKEIELSSESAVVVALEDLSKLVAKRCFAEPEDWSEVLVKVLHITPHHVVAALKSMKQAIAESPCCTLIKTFLTILESASLLPDNQTLWDDLMTFTITTVLQGGVGEEVADVLGKWSSLVAACPSSTVVAATHEQLVKYLEKGVVQSTNVFSKVYTLPCLRACILDVSILDALWAQVTLRGEAWTPLVKDTGILGGPILDYDEATGLASWANAITVFVSGSDKESALSLALHYCKAKLLADARMVNDELGYDCAQACEDVLGCLCADEVVEHCLHELDSGCDVNAACAIYILRQLAVHSEEGQLAVLKGALPPRHNHALSVLQMAISAPSKSVPEDALAAITEWCSEIAEMDEVGEPVEDSQILTALMLCLWVPRDDTVAEIISVLSAAALERLQAASPVHAWELRLKLSLALALFESNDIAEVAPHVANLFQKYAPAQKFAWSHSDSAQPLPTEGCLYHPLSQLVTSCTSDKVDVGSKALILTVLIDTLVAMGTRDLKRDEQDAVALLCECLANISTADLGVLSPQWGSVVCEMFLSSCKEVLSYTEADDEDTEESVAELRPVSGSKHITLALSAALGRLDIDQLVEGALPEVGKIFISQLLELGERLNPQPKPVSQNTFRTVFDAQHRVLAHTAQLQCYLVGWYLILDLLDRVFYNVSVEDCTSPIRGAFLEELKENDILKTLMNVLSGLMLVPKWAVLRTIRPDLDTQETPVNDQRDTLLCMTTMLPDDLNTSLLHLSRFGSLGDVGLSAVLVFNKLLGTVPVSPRRWVNDCDPSLKESMNNFVVTYLSPDLIKKELNYVVEKGGGKLTFSPSDELKVRVQPNACSVILEYDYQDTIVSVKMLVPPSFPLASIQHPSLDAQVTRAKAGLREDVWRRWLVQMTAKLLNKSARLWDCVQLWQQNLTKHFDGQDPCPICYQVVNTSTQQLPTMECSGCKGKYHKLCLYKWFKQSNNSTCPLCRKSWCA